MVSQTPEITSLSSPKGYALFSLFSQLLSFSVMLTGKGHQVQLQNAPSAFTKEWGCLKSSTNYWDWRVVSSRPDHDNHCFFIYRKVSDFLFPLCQPTAWYRCTLESKYLLEEVTEPFHFWVFHCIYIYIYIYSDKAPVSNSGWSALSQVPPRTHLGTVFTPMKTSKSHPGNKQQWENIKHEL